MTVLAVAFNGTRVNASDANTNWDNYPTGGQAPSAEANNRFQGTNVVNQKLSTQTLDGLMYSHGSTYDMTGATYPLFFGKVYVTDYGAVDATYGVALAIGSASTARNKYNVGGTGAKITRFEAYPARGGYIVAAINPNVTGWYDNSSTPTLTAVDWWGAQADWVAAANAKSENFCFDAIDIGSGLTITAGTGADPVGTFPDFVEADQNDSSNGRWGVCFGAGTFVEAQGMLTIGSATATEFTDNAAQLVFLDSYCDDGDFGVTSDIQNASTVIEIGSTITGLGALHTEADTRPDHIVSGTSGSYDFYGILTNHRNVEFTSVCDVYDANIECKLLTQASANISDTIIKTTSLTSVACLQDPTFGTTTDLHDVTFIQAGAGHALEIDTAGDYTATNIEFSGFNASNSQPDSAIDVTAGTGTVNLTVSGGASANYTYNSAGATVNILTSVLVTINVVDEAGNDVNSAQTSVYLTSDDTQVMNEDTVSGTATEAFTGSTPAACYIRVRKGSTGTTKYIPASTTGTIESSTGLTTTVVLREDGINAT